MQMPLLEPKFQPPRLHASLVERKRILARLDAIREHRITLICAPAGFGKTTAISQWMEQHKAEESALPTAWISLGPDDNDPLLFWRYAITACQTLSTEIGNAPLLQLSGERPPFGLPSLEIALTLLLNNMTRLARSGLLILEDYHVITHPTIHETMNFFLEHLPTQLHVAILTRSEPPLPLVRWRAQGHLYEMHTTDLRFSREEMVRFFQQTPPVAPPISTETLHALEARLEGWAAGLRLLGLALRGTSQHEAQHVLSTFAGEQRSLQSYFVSEVLSTLPVSLQDFLLRTSILDLLTGPLCDAITGRQESARLLAEIEQAGIFLTALDRSGKWYRYHALFAEAMQAEVRRILGEEAVHALSLRASCWYEQQGMFAEAVEAAFQARDTLRAATLIEDILSKTEHFILGPDFFQEIKGFYTLRRWLEQVPEELFQSRPLLSLGYATALLLVIVMEQPPPSPVLLTTIEGSLERASKEFRALGDRLGLGGTFALQALIAREQGAMKEAIVYARESLAWLPEGEMEWRSMSMNVIGAGKLINGRLAEAQKIFLELCAICETLGNRAILRANTALLNVVNYEQGKLRQAAEAFRHMLAESRTEEDRDDIAHSSLLLALLTYEWNELQTAEQHAMESLELSQQLGNEEFQVQATLVLACIDHSRGQFAQAQQRCTALLARLPASSPMRFRLGRMVQLAQARFALARGDLSAVERWRRSNPFEKELPIGLRDREELLVARWLLSSGKSTEVLNLLTDLLDAAQRWERTHSMLEIQAVLVLAQFACGQMQEVERSLQILLSHAHTEGYLRLFLDEGETMITLLRTMLPKLHKSHLVAIAQTILQAANELPEIAAAPAYTLLPDPLSPQEQRVLRLLIMGRTNPEIARDLIVSINTVKVHLKNIYGKLNVHTRLEACEVARRLDFH